MQSSGCLACHQGPVENEFETKSLAELANWDSGCLGEGSVTGSPNFGFSKEDRAGVAAFVSTGFAALERHVDSEFAARQLVNLNCIGCHDQQIDLVPALDLLGDKVKPEYGATIIAGTVEEKPRPWIAALGGTRRGETDPARGRLAPRARATDPRDTLIVRSVEPTPRRPGTRQGARTGSAPGRSPEAPRLGG